MKIDERDEQLGAALDQLVADLPLELPDLERIAGSRRRPRWAAAAAAVAVVAVFVSVIAVAATQVGREADRPNRPGPVASEVPEGWRTRTVGPSPGFAVGVSYPEAWKLRPSRATAIDAPAQPVFRIRTSADLTGPACGELEVFPGVPTISIGRQSLRPDQAVVSVWAYTGGGWGGEPPRLPEFMARPERLSWDQARLREYDCGRPATAATFFLEDRGRWIFHVAMGSAVMDGRVGRTILEVLDGLRLPPDPTAPIRFLPAPGWFEDADPGDRIDPVSAWTSNVPMVAAGTFPDVALLPPDGVLVAVMQVGDEPPAPDNPNFPPADLPLDVPDYVETSWEGSIEGRSRSTLNVAVNGRALDISIYYGTTAPSEEQRADAEAALERLLVAEASPSP